MCLASLVLVLPGCGRSQDSQVREAIAAKFPAGMRRCLGFSSDVIGIKANGGPSASAFYYSSAGPTDPLHRAYVFYAGFVSAPIPDLVRGLTAIGKLHRTVVDATADFQMQEPGPELVSPVSGLRVRPIAYRHESRVLPVAIYETAVQDPDFDYQTRFPQRGGVASSAGGLPSRMYQGPLPPADTRYQIPLVEPYATSVVSRACYPETIGRILAVRRANDWGGTEHVQADVEFDGHPADWMSTPAFRRAAVAPDTEPLDAPRRVTILFDVTDGRLAYARELPR